MNIRKEDFNKNGFTLIEIIASLVILGIMGTVFVVGLGKVVEGFVFTKLNAETAQKGHIAMNRLTKEFINIASITSGASESISFTSYSYIDGTLQANRSVSRVGTTLELDGDVLIDNVNSFSMIYLNSNGMGTSTSTSKVIEITLTLDGANSTTSVFTTRVAPRSM
jgi:prepilin-type N-terminal cleavage/methylation domain-containing protein